MNEWQRCPVCDGDGMHRGLISSSAVATRYSHPCHACNGSGMVPRPTLENVREWIDRITDRNTEGQP